MVNGIKALLISAEPDGEGDALVTFRVPADARLYTGEYLLVQAFAVEMAKAHETPETVTTPVKSESADCQLGTQWRDINTLPDSDDLIWLRKGNTYEGPRPPSPFDADEFDEWALCEPPK